VSRYDKYDPKVGGYRAQLAANWPDSLVEHVVGVGHDAEGRLVVGSGVTGIKGVVVLTKARKAGEIVDVMTSGEIVEFGPNDGTAEAGVDFGDPATDYFAAADGDVTDTGGVGAFYVGHTVSGQRLIVRFNSTAVAA
jgi:hypothetical protein